MQKALTVGAYVYLGKRKQYAIIRQKLSDNELVVKVKRTSPVGQELATTPSLGCDFEELQVDVKEDDIRIELSLTLRVVVSEEKRFTIKMKRPTNDKIKMLAEEVGELLNLTRYELTFFYKNEPLGLNERIGDRDIGSTHSSDEMKNYLLCLKGGAQGPKTWKRFTTVDDPCRLLNYIRDDESVDAITYIPTKNIQFAGFSVYPVHSPEFETYKCIYRYKIG